MGTVHAKAEENFTEASEFVNRNVPHDSADAYTFKEVDLEAVRARVDKINVDGLARTKNDIVEDCIRELFRAKDFQDVLIKAHRARVKLDELGCFKNISVFIDTSKGPKATSDGLEVTFNVKEHKRLTGGVSTQVGNNEGSLLVGLRAPNLFGRGERVQVEYSHGSKRTSNFNVAFIKPFRGRHRPTLTTSVFQSQSEWPSSGYRQLERGSLLDLSFYSTPFLKHNLQWEANIRDLSVLSRTSSFEVREQSGLSLKSALRHILACDLRDDLIFPSTGSLFQVTSEVAGVGGDVGFLKNDVFLQGNYSVLEDIVIQGCLSGGYMSSISNDMKISMSDMYYLGGPLCLRGFQMRGVGPHSDGDALGSTGYWSAGLHLFTPLPFRPGRGGFGELFRTHLFVNGGNVGNFRVGRDSSILDTLRANMRISYGLGVALRLGNMARLEVNYCFPYIFDKGDQTHPGVQFGIGVQFL
ncbi:sorting and assembly machinery component 50 homolog [Anoplophora glabripennis]|uniref:Sorting and assembly machinery component n=1 Tax=Anoplophora glabripennis TaxID=217634 RepID=V5G5V9_ANOGL|nr:sorting and assembly machinery component 50 homolog [Anoplophora glabripennis]